MKKWGLILALTAAAMLLLAPSALALDPPYTHGDFAANSKGCADCHVTHAATAQKLLKFGTNQTTFCLACHGQQAIGSPFDVRNGKIMKTANWDSTSGNVIDTSLWNDSAWVSPSLAGGFANSYDFGDSNTYKAVTSIHNVRGSQSAFGTISNVTTYEYVYGNTIPGGSGSLDFECGSCHDPHAGGAYTNDQADKNPRLLKEKLFNKTGLRVKMHIDPATNVPTQYTSGFNGWCGGCHDIFNTESTSRAGYVLEGGRTKYMHQFNRKVYDTVYGGDTNPYTVEWLALEVDGTDKEISCITCHRAHGSSAQALPTNFSRYAAYKAYDGTATTTTTGSGSALLRLKQRDVCYKCHAEAKYNYYGYTP